MTDTPAPVFVVCCARSGSTLLRYVLDTHPRVGCPAELHLLLLYRQLRWTHALTAGGASEFDPAVAADAAASARAAIDEIMAGYCRRRGKAVWCEKSVVTVDHPDLLAEGFGDARLLCLHRHGLDVTMSALEVMRTGAGGQYGFEPFVARTPQNEVDGLIDYWCDKTERGLALEREWQGQALRLRYEDLVADPAATMRQLFEFLGEAWDPALAETVFTRSHEVGPGDAKIVERTGFSDASVGRGARIPRNRISADRARRLDGLLRELGYDALD